MAKMNKLLLCFILLTVWAAKASGVSYIVWGKHYCPRSRTLYSGMLGGTYVLHSAGSSNQVCLPDIPHYSTYASGSQQRGRMYPGKYDTQSYVHLKRSHGRLISCAACYNDRSSTVIMIPAAVKCPSEWKEEYQGYLMTQPDVAGYHRQEFVCVHNDMDGKILFPGRATQSYLLSPVETVPNGGFTGLYDSSKELTCIVCSK